MKLWVDDERPAPLGWERAVNAESAKAALQRYDVEQVSLDHDLGLESESGYELLCWMFEQGYWPPTIHVHSMNPVGRRQMLEFLERPTARWRQE